MIRLTVLFLLIGIQSIVTHAQSITERLQTHVYFLAADSLEGRLTGSKGEKIAFDYIAEHFENMGIAPLSDTYAQPFDFVFSRRSGSGTVLSVNGTPLNQDAYYPISYSASSFCNGTAIYAGYGIDAPEKQYNDYENLDVTGKIVVLEVSSPDGNHPHSAYINHLPIATKIEKAIEKGAAGIVFVNADPNSEIPEATLRTTVQPTAIPIVFLTEKSQLPDGATIEMTVDIETDERTGHNVIGWLNNEAASTVVIGAHYDHLGYGEVGSLYIGDEPAIHNGADDNASGVATIIELARALANNEDLAANNYLFIAFSGEELGLYGSGYFVKHPNIDLNSINYMINLDMVGRLDESGKLAVNGIGTSPAITAAIETLTVDGISAATTKSGIGPSDHTSFYLKDIPVVHFFTGTHEDYHKPSDDADLINYDGMTKVYQYILSMIEALNDDGKIAFTPTKDDNNKNAPRFSVSLGVIPDYMFDGKGMRIEGVRDGKPADIAGIEDGDIVIQMGPVSVIDMMSYMKGLSQFKKGDTTTVTVLRNEEERNFEVTF